jgi:integrase/recombinase XerD
VYATDEHTIVGYVGRVRPFLDRRVVAGRHDLERVTPDEISAFVEEECSRRRSRGPARVTVTALRSLLRFRHVDGVVDE